MKPYRDLSGQSFVVGYEEGKGYIKVKFKDGSVYLYTYEDLGVRHIESMKFLAKQGYGLEQYIQRHAEGKGKKITP